MQADVNMFSQIFTKEHYPSHMKHMLDGIARSISYETYVGSCLHLGKRSKIQVSLTKSSFGTQEKLVGAVIGTSDLDSIGRHSTN